MTWSLNEIEALARKAARGAGYSWGLAEDTGKATRWLEARGLPGVATLATHLHAVDRGDVPAKPPRSDADGWVVPGLAMCPICAGSMLADGMAADQTAPLTLVNLHAPLLLLPFLAWMAEAQGRPVGVDLIGTAITLTAKGQLTVSAPISAPDACAATLRFGAASEDQSVAEKLRSGCPPDNMAALNSFAARTYAPATEESRLAGAGAGLSDND